VVCCRGLRIDVRAAATPDVLATTANASNMRRALETGTLERTARQYMESYEVRRLILTCALLLRNTGVNNAS